MAQLEGGRLADQEAPGRCALCGGAVGPDGRTLAPPPPPPAAARLQSAPTRKVEDVDDHLTPVQRFERAIKRRDAARLTSHRGKTDGPDAEK
jgi:hypothetical protein